MTITFVLPRAANIPMGGFRIVYEYANRLHALGHTIHIVHVLATYPGPNLELRLRSWILNRLMYFGLRGTYRPNWFPLHKDIQIHATFRPSNDAFPVADAIVATAWQTAEWIAVLPESKGRKYYFLQSVESLFDDAFAERVCKTWYLPLHKIAIADWIIQEIKNHGCDQPIVKIPNGYDLNEFGLDIPLSVRNPTTVMTLYHPDPKKGFEDAFNAVLKARKEIPEIQLLVFGAFPKPANLPDWVSYHREPDRVTLRRLFNESSVFLAASWLEGWALPPCEATLCGASICATDIGGYSELATHEETALVSKVKHPGEMAIHLLRLIRDPQLRNRLNTAAIQRLHQYDWEASTRMFESELGKHST